MKSKQLRQLISKWFYAASVTTYYSTSIETTVQADLNAIKLLRTSEEFHRIYRNKRFKLIHRKKCTKIMDKNS